MTALDTKALEALARAYDREDAAQRGALRGHVERDGQA